MKRKIEFGKPADCDRVLLHACCAPCSSAIVEWLLQHEVRPTIYYYNPNIFPREEYEIRKNESKRHAESLGIEWIDGDYNHEQWQQYICGMENEPERGRRCEQCFLLRMKAAAEKAALDRLNVWCEKIIKRCNRQERLTGWAEVERLQDKIDSLTRAQEMMKAANCLALVRPDTVVGRQIPFPQTPDRQLSGWRVYRKNIVFSDRQTSFITSIRSILGAHSVEL